MNKQSRKFLYDLLLTPSPSGFEAPIQRVVKSYINKYADNVRLDVHGNFIACANPKGTVRVMLAGHCDQIGMMITHIDDRGFIYFNQIGGIDPSVVPGSYVQIHTARGVVEGVIGYKPVHLMTAEERGKKTELKKLWIDIGVADGKEANKYVSIGDPVTYKLGVQELGENRIGAPACDDKVGVFVVMESLRMFSEMISKRRRHDVALYAVSTVQEEIGQRGARTSCFGLDPHIGIAVDVSHASDNPGAEAREIGSVKLGSGPTVPRGANFNHLLVKHITETAKNKRIKYQPHFAPNGTGTDANAIQISRSGVATALLGIPNRYMHTQVELVDLRDLEYAARLIAFSVFDLSAHKRFIPS
ncbi:MAG: M42 family metallopeptidase [Deltaproteobacteria bacterium]|nr:M42 family metallopeptidase [Deltaproteobacteria bacterium]